MYQTITVKLTAPTASYTFSRTGSMDGVSAEEIVTRCPPTIVGGPMATARTALPAYVHLLNPRGAILAPASELAAPALAAEPTAEQGAGEDLLKQPAGVLPPEASKLDLVFTIDCTLSMGSYIASAKRNIDLIVRRLANAEGYDLRFGLVAYRDHLPMGDTFVTMTFPFTSDVVDMRRNLNDLTLGDGGDGPEAVGAALHATRIMPWRNDATKVCVLIADAPPHGLGETGDGFPDGEPDGSDPMVELDELSVLGVALYVVGCQPTLSYYEFATDFFVAAAERTNGQAVSLSSAAGLADVIMGGAIEEMDLSKLANEMELDVHRKRIEQPALDEEQLVKSVHSDWMAKGVRSRHLTHNKLQARNGGALRHAGCIKSAKASFEAAAALFHNSQALMPPSSLQGGGEHSSSVEIAEGTISYEQMARLFSKCKKTGKL
mmetsp:Transcript_18309/g.39504  ORF Transcript_18309/g.39504 Transcript_18309/m.39504 type:complete len:434 (-) Transcript_18309:170-1471(-)